MRSFIVCSSLFLLSCVHQSRRLSGEASKPTGREVLVYIDPDDVGLCSVNLRREDASTWLCTLLSHAAPAGTKGVLLSEQNHFVVFEDPVSREDVTATLLVDRVEVRVRTFSEQRAGQLVSDKLRANFDRLRMVHYMVPK